MDVIKVSFQNSGGELNSREVKTPVDVVAAIAEMIADAGEVYPGDSIIVSGDAEDDPE